MRERECHEKKVSEKWKVAKRYDENLRVRKMYGDKTDKITRLLKYSVFMQDKRDNV